MMVLLNKKGLNVSSLFFMEKTVWLPESIENAITKKHNKSLFQSLFYQKVLQS